jgi:hypothetical protein
MASPKPNIIKPINRKSIEGNLGCSVSACGELQLNFGIDLTESIFIAD